MSEWGPWIEHNGKGCPLPDWQIVEAVDVEGEFYEADRVDTLCWDHDCGTPVLWWIIRYRIRKPRGLTILEEIARSVKEPQELGA
ncbi:hypothetical protein [Mameliella alba]|uniref:Uncharacterized protein n=1 Tax=Mameliella alba TaxID=561184 RepID=A0A0B3RIM0_9RHOB|nr:hypothetical protein [Mameliella alba]KHQ51115.1 hypothetical protein OA50_04486 [Mameliella alba]